MWRKQMIGIACATAAIATMALVWHCRPMFEDYAPAFGDPASRLAFALVWLLLPALTLLVGIIAAGRRGFYRDAIDGMRTPANWGLELNLRYNQGTLEQLVLAAIAWSGLAVQLPLAQLYLIPMMGVLFVAGRITFLIGYAIYPIARAYGMTLTALPTILAYVWLVMCLFS